MARNRERKVLPFDTAAVVGHTQALDTAGGQVDIDLRRTCVKAVFEQFLQRSGRSLDRSGSGSSSAIVSAMSPTAS